MSSEELEKSLRSEIETYLDGRLNVLQTEVSRLQSQVNEAFSGFLERTSGNETEPSGAALAATIAEHLETARERGQESAVAAQVPATNVAALNAAVAEIDNQRSQADVLNALVNGAAGFAPRLGLFVVRHGHAQGWRACGLEGTEGNDAVRQVALSLTDEHPVAEACRTGNVWSGAPGTNAHDYLLVNKFGGEPPQLMAALPLVIRNKAVAVLYADSGAQTAGAVQLEALETLIRVTGMSIELLAVTRGTPRPVSVVAPVAPPAPEPPAAEPQAVAAAPAPVVPEEPAPAVAEPVATEEAVAAEEAVTVEETVAFTEPAPAPPDDAAPVEEAPAAPAPESVMPEEAAPVYEPSLAEQPAEPVAVAEPVAATFPPERVAEAAATEAAEVVTEEFAAPAAEVAAPVPMAGFVAAPPEIGLPDLSAPAVSSFEVPPPAAFAPPMENVAPPPMPEPVVSAPEPSFSYLPAEPQAEFASPPIFETTYPAPVAEVPPAPAPEPVNWMPPPPAPVPPPVFTPEPVAPAPPPAETPTLANNTTGSYSYTGPLGSARTYGGQIDLPIEVADDERRLHNDARRFARLLVSEIKLYNEPKVREGRDAGDIYMRLREAIDRSRQMYDKRVAPPVASRFDYFHYELVNTLAEGDPARLGPDYPGASA